MRRKVVVLFVLVVMGLGLFAASGPESPTLAASDVYKRQDMIYVIALQGNTC